MLHSPVQAMPLSWHSHCIGKKIKKAWNVAPFCLFWAIWKERNRRAFEDAGLSNQELKFYFLCNFLEWTKGGLGFESSSMIDFINWLDCQ